ncbi:hypothetical protein PVAND_007866 [Polypedilum vanderplanki]|uniref:Uncharacterized protein n=1 Tax=Polypedilum vanderplanki TaxID=319348 RepID=A0A9J6C8A4_POLVA|nr:hypothetical protein PVAND_007866 [Polypedilum vanderplanki]
MYYVVKNYKNEFYVVVKTWLQTIKGNVFAFYPPTEAQTNKALACLSTPGLDWTNEEVKIVSNQFLKYADAVSEMNKKLKFYDSAAEEEFEKKKSHARLHPVGNKSRGCSFNLAFEDESPAVKVQKISSVDANYNVMIGDQYGTEMLFSNAKNRSIERLMKCSKTDENFISIVNELKDLRIGLNINKNNIQMSFEKPKKISTQLELNEKEKSLDDFNQRDSYLKLVSDMARCLQKPSKSYSSEHGLVKSFGTVL